MSSQILEIYSASLTTYLPGAASLVQDVAPMAIQRGVNVDGSLREAPGVAVAIAGNPLEAGCGADGPSSGSTCSNGLTQPASCGECGDGLNGTGLISWNRNNRICGDVRLDTGTYSPFDIDIAMPAPGFSWMIGRTYNARQEIDSTHHDSDGYQGRNWPRCSRTRPRGGWTTRNWPSGSTRGSPRTHGLNRTERRPTHDRR